MISGSAIDMFFFFNNASLSTQKNLREVSLTASIFLVKSVKTNSSLPSNTVPDLMVTDLQSRHTSCL